MTALDELLKHDGKGSNIERAIVIAYRRGASLKEMENAAEELSELCARIAYLESAAEGMTEALRVSEAEKAELVQWLESKGLNDVRISELEKQK